MSRVRVTWDVSIQVAHSGGNWHVRFREDCA
jgi:hypothetical protein